MFKNIIKLVASQSKSIMIAYKSINPFTGELLKDFLNHSEQEVNTRLDNVTLGYNKWRIESLETRINFIKSIKDKLLLQKDFLARTITLEVGKPIRESKAEIEKCASLCDYYINSAEGFLEPQKQITIDGEAEVCYHALGGIIGIMPWNFPFWQVFRFVIPNLIVGNVCVLKHAPNVPQCALALEELFYSDYNVFTNLYVSNDNVAEIKKKDIIQGVTLTGSSEAGKKVGRIAGENIKKVVLELGGNDAFVVMEDADLDKASDKLIKSRFLNTGQSCIGAKRLIISHKIKTKFLTLLKNKLDVTLKSGDPFDESVTIGVMAREDLKLKLIEQVQGLIAFGATVLYDKVLSDSPNSFPLMLLETTSLSKENRDIELFGPVLQIIEYTDTEKAFMLVNQTDYGLGCSIWTEDIKKAKKISLLIDTGSVFINEMVFSSPSLPFGGVKKSGVGRELGKEGLIEFTNLKSIYWNNN